MLGYLKAANDFGALAARTLVTEATNKIAAAVRHGSDATLAPCATSTTAPPSHTYVTSS